MATERIGLDFFTKALYPSHLKARNGSFYLVGKRVNSDRNTYDSDLYRLEPSGRLTQLTSSHDVQDYALTDEGILFASLRDEKDKDAVKGGIPLTVYYCLPYDGGEASPYLRVPHTVTDVRWLPDGRALFLAVYDHALQSFLLQYDGNIEKAAKEKKEQDESVTCVDELPFWHNGAGFVNKKRTALFLFDGRDYHRLTDEYTNASNITLNESNTKALVTTATYRDIMPEDNTLCELDIESWAIAPVSGVPDGMVSDHGYGPDGSILALLTESDDPYGWVIGNPRLYSIRQGQCTQIDASGGAYNYYNSVGSDSKLGDAHSGVVLQNGNAYFLCTLMHNCHILQVNLQTGEFTQLTQADGMVEEFIPYQDGFAMIAMRDNALGEVYTIDMQGNESRISSLNTALMQRHETVTPIEVSFENKNGTTIYGWVMPPVGYVPGKVYPAILNIHGGPKTVYGTVFFHEMQYWCTQGYAVLFCNPTGGDGRGNDFADLRGKYGSVDYDDIMQFVDTVLTRFGFVSAARMGVTGGSYGGFMTNWIIGHTHRFRAAASQRSISNWIGFVNTSDIGIYFGPDQMQGNPWDDAEELWKASPLRYADKVKTPTLFIHSEEDYRCNMFEGIQMFYALRTFGVDTRLCLFKGENHELSRSGKPKNRIRRLREITRWMDKNLKAPI